MPVPMEFLRDVLGLLCVFFAYMSGRSATIVRQGIGKRTRLYGWAIRMVLCGVVLIYRHGADALAIGVWALAALAFAGGMWGASHQKPHEDLTHQIFPE